MLGRFTALATILLIYISVLFRSIYTLIERLETYNGMTNRQIFDYVVEKLREMGSCFDGTVVIAGHEVITARTATARNPSSAGIYRTPFLGEGCCSPSIAVFDSVVMRP